jgi:hypothetical protein
MAVMSGGRLAGVRPQSDDLAVEQLTVKAKAQGHVCLRRLLRQASIEYREPVMHGAEVWRSRR